MVNKKYSKVIALMFLVSLLNVSCVKPKKKLSDEIHYNCDVSVLIEREKNSDATMCYLKSIAKRCNKVDECLLRCWTEKKGDNVGGGCHHLCWGYAINEWEEPLSSSECKVLINKKP